MTEKLSASEALAQVRATVLDCAAAMDLLHAALTQERGLGHMPEGKRRRDAQSPEL
ncbi:hypothetical protein [Polaromonas hydrogenivorans]|uniref:Uncharacterized protein n=1 Tax=Polaromonas hydrogenivorans TaxID=335476 RepID=A0AAU7LY83_9BURK